MDSHTHFIFVAGVVSCIHAHVIVVHAVHFDLTSVGVASSDIGRRISTDNGVINTVVNTKTEEEATLLLLSLASP